MLTHHHQPLSLHAFIGVKGQEVNPFGNGPQVEIELVRSGSELALQVKQLPLVPIKAIKYYSSIR